MPSLHVASYVRNQLHLQPCPPLGHRYMFAEVLNGDFGGKQRLGSNAHSDAITPHEDAMQQIPGLYVEPGFLTANEMEKVVHI